MKSMSKIYVYFIYALWFIGAIVCIIGFIGEANMTRAIINFVGAGIVVIAFILQFAAVKCPYCGSKKAGRALPLGKKQFQCPECKKTIEIK